MSFRRWLRPDNEPARQDYERLIRATYPEFAEVYLEFPDEQLEAIGRAVLARVNRSLPYPVWIGIEPHSDFSAQAIRTEHGALVLFSIGFLTAVTDYCHLLADQVVIQGEDRSRSAGLTPAEAQHYLRRLVENHTKPRTEVWVPGSGLPSSLAFEITLTEDEQSFAEELILWSVRFTLAHELGHIRLGHLDSGVHDNAWGDEIEDQTVATGAQALALVRRLRTFGSSWVDEMEADEFGLRLLQSLPQRLRESPYFGPVVFSGLTDLLFTEWTATGTFTREQLHTHPHPVLRRSASILTVHPDNINARFPTCDGLLSTIDHLRTGMMTGPRIDREMDADSIDQLLRWNQHADHEAVSNLIFGNRGGETLDGVRVMDDHDLMTHLSGDFETARAAVALVALSALELSRVVSASRLIQLVRFRLVFRECFAEDYPKEVAAAERVFNRSVSFMAEAERIYSEGVLKLPHQTNPSTSG